MTDKPTRCIDPVMKFCQECRWGWVHYPEWVETAEDLADWPEDEPTEEELKEFERMCRHDRA